MFEFLDFLGSITRQTAATTRESSIWVAPWASGPSGSRTSGLSGPARCLFQQHFTRSFFCMRMLFEAFSVLRSRL